MTESFLWLVNHTGDTFSLGTARRHFRQLVCTLEDVIAIKRLASSQWCAWAVGHDHRPYLYVFSSDVPIRIPETTYENQRWTPMYGFSKKSMLPSDRYAWSDETGTLERPKESVRLPSSHWEWDGDWVIDDNLRGEVVELGGWQYAVDFPAVYTPEQHWNSFVRRRKWIHFRRFFATDCWANISDMEMVENLECVIDISVGCFLLPSQPDGFLAVWAVVNSGNVYVRTSVHRNNPEGYAWSQVSLEQFHGIINISVGATNLIWAVTWDGQGLVRTDVSRNKPYGSSWVIVDSPDTNTHLMQVAVGRNAVWALSRDNKVWFRKGTWGDHTFWSKECAVGSMWVEMVGEMSQVALSSNDQVFAIDTAGQNVYFRTGVSSQDLTGKTWQRVTLREDLSPFKHLGLLDDEDEFCDSSMRAPSESTSCSSVSLSTATSCSNNFNEDFSSNGDVFLGSISPSQPPEIPRMVSKEDYFPPAWSMSEGEEETEPDTPTGQDIPTTKLSGPAYSAALEDSQSEFPVFPSVETLEEFDAEIENPRIRSVSQYSLTDSLPHSSRTISPESSIATVQLGFTRSVSSQTNDNSIELRSDQGLTSQTHTDQEVNSDVDFIYQSSLSEAVENYQSSNDQNQKQAIFSPVNCSLYFRESKESKETSIISDKSSDIVQLLESHSDLTEVDRHLKILAVNDRASVEEKAGDTDGYNPVESQDFNEDTKEHSCLLNDMGVLKSIETNRKSSNAITNSIESKENTDASQPQPIIEESSKSKDNRAQDSANSMSPPVMSLSGTADEESVRKRSKSHRRASNSRKSDPLDEPDSIVFKAPRKKKDKNRKKSKDFSILGDKNSEPSLVVEESQDLNSVYDVPKEQEKNEVNVHELVNSIKEECLCSEDVNSERFPTALNDTSANFAPLGVASLSNPSIESSEKPIDSLETKDEVDNGEIYPNAAQMQFKPVLNAVTKRSGSNDDSQKVSLQFRDDSVIKLFANHKSDICNTLESNELNDDSEINPEVKIHTTLEKIAKLRSENLKPLDNNAKTDKSTTVSISCQTDNSKFQPAIKKSPKHMKTKKTQETSTTNWCPMTKLMPSVKKPTTTAVLSSEKADNLINSSCSESDEIADFVTDLPSEDSEIEEFPEQSKIFQEQKVASDQLRSEFRGGAEVKSNDTLEASSCLLTDSIAVESVRASSVTSIVSSSSSAVSRKMSGGIRDSPSLPASLQSKQSTFYRQTPSPAISSSPSTHNLEQMPDTLAPLSMVAAQPRLSWRWLDATSCVIDNLNKVDWLSHKHDAGGNEPKTKISKQLRQKLLQKIITRNKREAVGFSRFETAVEKSTWVLKASMQMLQHSRHSRWIDCSVELEQGIGYGGSDKGTLTVHYSYRRKQRHTQLQLSDLICVMMNTDPDLTTAFSVFTPDLNLSQQPLVLKAASEKEAADWLDFLSTTKASAWNLNQPIPAGSIWSCSFNGDILVSCDTQDNGKPYLRSWGLHGGHMAQIETSPTGVTWGLGFDKMPHVYNGGYGGAVCTGQSHMSDNTQQMVDTHRVYVYENQKWFPVVGWCNKGVFHHNFHWVTSSGQFVTSQDQVKLPSSKWHWISDWTIDFGVAGGVDSSGWQYSNIYNGSFHRSSNFRDQYRRRRWLRRCRVSLMGPWISAGSLSISDLSIQIDPVKDLSDPIVMWAVATNGDVLCRYGITQTNPMGQSWVHISRDQDKPFTSISVGSRGQVWGVATDGSAWYRTGVTADNPVGKNWLQVVPPPPGNFRLRLVSAGALAVWAVDTGDNLWRRENITPTFPEGTGWESIASKVKRVSVGLQDQVWIVADAYFQKSRQAPGVIYYRQGISDKHPGGTGWQRVIGSGWAHVSVRGLTPTIGNTDSGIEES